jgi:signal transduction histidine kinase
MMKFPIVAFPIENELDIILAHKRAFQLGEFSGLTYSERTRFATAISEVCRNSLDFAERGEVCFEIQVKKATSYLVCTIFDGGPEIKNPDLILKSNNSFPLQSREEGIINARRLVTFFAIEPFDGKQTRIILGFPSRLKKQITKELIKDWINSFSEYPVSPYEELKYRNLQLIHLYDELQKLLSIISHDLRNPVSSLVSSAEILKKEIENLDKETIKQFANIIHNSSSKVYKQLNELVEWAKFQSQKKVYYPVKLQLLQIIEESLELLEESAKQKSIEIRNRVYSDIYVKADPLMLRSVFQNLFTNAIKYTPAGGSITITAKKAEEVAEITIKDTGVGMTKDTIENLFTHFTSTAGTGNEQGSGLGMKLVEEFIRKHGGEIEVESEPGKGTAIRFTVPLFFRLS